LPESHTCTHIEKARAPKEEATPFEYKVTYRQPRQTVKFWFSPTEIKHLTLSALLVTGVGISSFGFRLISTDPEVLIASSLIFVGAFILHEIAHKLVAQRFGLWAEFRLILFGALLTLLTMFSPLIKIIAPGAVLIAGSASKEVVGKTSVAGPLTNIALSSVLLVLAFLADFFLPLQQSYFVIFIRGAAFNAWIALFNAIPFGMLDGLKIFDWNRIVWALVFVFALGLTVVTFPYI